MGFIDSFKSRLKNDDEAEFERAFREGSWPEGVDDFEPMANTGSFLPAEPDIDPLADESLPGNRMKREAQGRPVPVQDVYAPAEAPSPFGVIGAESKPLPFSLPAEGAEFSPADVTAATSLVDEAAEGSVRVVERTGKRAQGTPVASKPFAERLRERVEAGAITSNPIGQRAMPQAQPPRQAPQRPSARIAADHEGAAARSDMWSARRVGADIADEGRERAARPSESARFQRAQDGAGASEPPRRPRAVPAPQPERAPGDAVPVQCDVVRPRLYDEVANIANVVIGQHRPVVIVLSGSPADTSRRILDFSFGLCCGSGAELREVGHRVYALMPKGTALTDYDIAQLKRSGVMIRG